MSAVMYILNFLVFIWKKFCEYFNYIVALLTYLQINYFPLSKSHKLTDCFQVSLATLAEGTDVDRPATI